MVKTIFSIGVDSENSDYLNEKIGATNFICLLFVLLSIPFFWFTYSLIPDLAYLPILFFLNALAGIFFNAVRLHNASRFLASIGFLLLLTIYTSFVTPDHEPLIAGLLAMQLFCLLPPWILFDFEEKGALIFYCSISILITLFLPALNDVFTHEISPEIVALFKEGWPFYVGLFISVFGMTGALLFLEVSTFQTGNRNAQLISEMSAKADMIAANEKKLNDYIAEIEAGKLEAEKRQWTSGGIAKFSEILRSNHHDSQKMYDALISGLVKYMGANQGGLFLLEGQGIDQKLSLVAMYAYDRKKYLQRSIEIGEGILGQAVLEKTPIFMTDIPHEYVLITSGLGDSPPRSLLVSPLMVNEEVYGVIELASFRKFQPYELEFINKVGESIASTVSTVRVSERTKTLLEELQQQTEEMKSQEEEMRQNMEELIATQEEMQRKEREYLQRIQDLETGAAIQSYN